MGVFLRNKPDFFESIFGTWYYFICLGVFALLVFLTFFLYKKGHGETTLETMAIILLTDQILENIWFWTAPYLVEPLPLYHCRTAKVLLPFIVLFFRKSKHLKNFLIGISLYGCLAAQLFPSIDPFKFPHITNFDFYISHMMIGTISILLILEDKMDINFKIVINLEIFMLCFNIFDTAVAHLSGKNYGFFLVSPVMSETTKNLPLWGYTIIAYLSYAVLLLIGVFFWKLIRDYGIRVESFRKVESL